MLASTPAILDLSMWLSYRCYVAKRPEAIPLFRPSGLVNQIGSVRAFARAEVVQKLELWMGTIRVTWTSRSARLMALRTPIIDHGTAVLQ